MQDPCPPSQDHWALQTSNLLQRGDLWPYPAAVPARGGNSKTSECCSSIVCMFPTCLSRLVQVILQLRERPDRAAKARRGLALSLQPLKGFDYDSFLSPPSTPETQQDAGRQAQTAVALPGPALRLQATQEKGPRREVFVWLGLQCGHHGQHLCPFYCTNLHHFSSDKLLLLKFLVGSFTKLFILLKDTILGRVLGVFDAPDAIFLTSVTCLPFSLWTPSLSLLSLLNSQLCETQILLLMQNSLLISYWQHMIKEDFFYI